MADRLAHDEVEGVGIVRLNLGAVEYDVGNYAEAEAHFADAEAIFRRLGFRTMEANARRGLAAVEAHTDREDSAARRLGAVDTFLGDTGWGDEMGLAAQATEAARLALGDERLEALFQEGAAGGPT